MNKDDYDRGSNNTTTAAEDSNDDNSSEKSESATTATINKTGKEIKKEMDRYEERIKSATVGAGAQDEATAPAPPEGDPTRSDE